MAHIKVPEQTPKISYAVTTPEEDTFNINFVIFESDGSDIDVFDLDVLLSPALYVITPVPGTEGGFIGGTLVLNVPVTDTTIVIVRNIVLERTTDFPTAGPFNINALNTELDRMAGMIQQIREAAAVSFGEAISVVEAANLQIKEPASIRGGKVLGFDANGDLDLQTGVGLWRDNWVTSTFYGLRDVVRDDAAGDDTKNLYICVIEHTSGTWSTDLAANNWDLMVDVESVTISETNAAASEAAAGVSETNAGVSESNASTSESNASTSETNASTSESNAASSASAASTSETNAANSASDAADSAAEINLPDLSGSTVNDILVVNSGKTGYDFTAPFTDVVQDTTPELGGFLDPKENYIGSNKGSDIASASSLVIGTDGDYFNVTGTTSINDMVVANNRTFRLHIDDGLAIIPGSGITMYNNPPGINLRPGVILEFRSIAANTVIGTFDTDDGTAALGGDWHVRATGVLSNNTFLNISGFSSVDHERYNLLVLVLFNVISGTDSVTAEFRVGGTGGIDSGSTDYGFHIQTTKDSVSTYSAVSDSSTDAIQTSGLIGNDTGEGYNAIIYIHRSPTGEMVPLVTGIYTSVNPSGVMEGGSIFGRRKAVITLDQIRFFFSSGLIASARFAVYGVNHV